MCIYSLQEYFRTFMKHLHMNFCIAYILLWFSFLYTCLLSQVSFLLTLFLPSLFFFPASFTASTVLFLPLSFQWLMSCSRLRRKIFIQKKCMATVSQTHSLTSLSHLTCNTIPITCGVCACVYICLLVSKAVIIICITVNS